MPHRKIMHSKRVALLTKKLSNNIDIYNAALYHDFLERGGKENKMRNIISFYSYRLVKALTKDSYNKNLYNDTLEDIKINFTIYSENFKNDIIIIKLCDRVDNIKQRLKKNKLKKSYLKKSVELIQYLYDNYTGDKQKIISLIDIEIPIIKKYLYLDDNSNI